MMAKPTVGAACENTLDIKVDQLPVIAILALGLLLLNS